MILRVKLSLIGLISLFIIVILDRLVENKWIVGIVGVALILIILFLRFTWSKDNSSKIER